MPDKRDFRKKWRYRKKAPKYRKPILMDVLENIPTIAEVTSEGLQRVSLPKGRYEIQVTAHPDPEKRGRNSKWVLIVSNGHLLGMSKNYVRSLQRDGLVRIFIPGE